MTSHLSELRGHKNPKAADGNRNEINNGVCLFREGNQMRGERTMIRRKRGKQMKGKITGEMPPVPDGPGARRVKSVVVARRQVDDALIERVVVAPTQQILPVCLPPDSWRSAARRECRRQGRRGRATRPSLGAQELGHRVRHALDLVDPVVGDAPAGDHPSVGRRYLEPGRP